MRSSYFASDKMGGNGGLWKSLVDTPTPTPVMRLMSDSNGSTLGGGREVRGALQVWVNPYKHKGD